MKALSSLQPIALTALATALVSAAPPLDAAPAGQARALFTPFRGELQGRRAAMAGHLQTRPETRRARVAAFERGAFDGNTLQLALFPDADFTAEKTDIGFTGVKSRTWTGRTPTGGSVAFVINGDRISGSVSSPAGKFEIYPLGSNECVVVQHHPNGFPDCAVNRVAPPMQTMGVEVPRPADAGNEVFSAAAASPGLGDTPTANRVRVLVAYTVSAHNLTSLNFGRTMQEHIDLAVVESNQGYANSGITMRMELACLYQTAMTETTVIQDDVANFRANGDGNADEVHGLRTTYDADMCCLITDGRDTDWCGWAYDFDYTSYANMFQCTAYNCATGDYTFAHEFGHTQGCRHNDDGGLTPFPYAHGFRNGSNWRTVMGLANGTGAPRLNYWSNPNINSPVAPMTAMGTAVNGANFANDNRTALNVSDNTVVNHESTPVNAALGAGASFGNDEAADKVVTGTLSAATFTAHSGSRVQFRAGTNIVLVPPFWARSGSSFRARLASPLGDPAPTGDPARAEQTQPAAPTTMP